MRLHRPLVVFCIAAALVAGAFAGLYLSRGIGRADSGREHAVALVNGTPITTDDLDVRLQEMLPFASYHGRVAPARLLALERAALDDLVLDELIYREAVAAGRRAPADEVEKELAAVRMRFDSRAQFGAALSENGLTELTFRERLARTVLVREARAAHARQSISDADIASYYRDNTAKFQRPERVHLLEILVRADPAEPSSRRSADRRARAILARLRRGERFDKVARACSEDEYRVKDGDMGFVHRGRLDAELEAAVFAAMPGRYELARSLYGAQVFKVVEREPATELSLDEARPIIAGRLERQRRDAALAAWHERLLAGARIEIRDPALQRTRPAELAIGAFAGVGSVSAGAARSQQ
jgi:parvulin-like peptidyl-prolyl isomerase